MSDEEISESEIIGLLGTYADALEMQATIAPGPDGSGDIENQMGGSARKKGDDMDNQESVNDEPEVVELDVVPTPAANPGRGRLLVAAAVVAVVAVVGAVFALNQDSSGVDTAQDSEVSEDEDAAQDEAVAVAGNDDASDNEASDDATAATDSAMAVADSGFAGFGGPGSVVFTDDGEFVSMGMSPDGAVISRSSNGTDWESEPVNGLPENALPSGGLVEVDGRWVTVVEVWEEHDEQVDETEFFFGPPETDRYIAVSDDLVNWTTSDFPDLGVEDGEFAYVIGLAASGDRVAMLAQVQDEGDDEMRILFDAGLISGDDLENFCGSDFGEGDAYIAYSCDYSEEMMAEEVFEAELDDSDVPATTIAPADAVDEVFPVEDFPQDELLRIEPGEPGYDEMAAIYNDRNFEDFPTSIVISGPVDGPYEVTDIPVTGYVGTIVGTDSGFVVASSDFMDNSARSASSVDGVTWTEASDISDSINVNTAAASGDRVAVVGQSVNSGEVSVFVSDDLGATWTNASIPSELFGAWGEMAGGPAGFAVRLQGSTEEVGAMNPFGDVTEITIESDGYTMTINLGSGTLPDGSSTLTGPDGTVIHDSIPDSELFEGDVENVARFEGQFDSTLVWLDPATGEDLVRFEEEQVMEQFEEIIPEFGDGGMFEESMASETWFSADGTTWTLLEADESAGFDEGYSSVAAVGDDEVLVRSETFVEPPQELFAFEAENREPTAEEEAALDEWFMNNNGGGNAVWTAIPVG